MIGCLRSFCLVKSRGFMHLDALGVESMVLTLHDCVSVHLIGTLKIGCPEDCMYLAHHEQESASIIASHPLQCLNMTRGGMLIQLHSSPLLLFCRALHV